jgi:hypothetical protein
MRSFRVARGTHASLLIGNVSIVDGRANDAPANQFFAPTVPTTFIA